MNLVWVCTKITDGNHNPRCKTCVRLIRKEFGDLTGPSSHRRKRKRSRAPSNDTDGRPQNHNRTERTTAQIPAAVEHAPPLIEYHVRTNEDDIEGEDDVLAKDDAPDEDDAVDETNDAESDRQQHDSAGPNRRRR